MARIPTYQPQAGLNVGGGVNLPPLDQTLARAVEGLGVSVEQVGAHLQQQEQQKSVFSAEQSYLQFQNKLKENYAEAQAQMPVAGDGWHDTWTPTVPGTAGEFDKAANEFLATIPQGLRDQYTQRVATLRTDWSGTAAVDQINERNKWFRSSLKDAAAGLELDIRRNGSANFDQFRASGDTLIQNSPLPPAEKAAMLKDWHANAAIARVQSLAATDPQAALDELNTWLGTGPNKSNPQTASTVSVIKGHEGFTPTPQWDVNAYRIGYGSDTVTRADGTVEKVTKDTAPITEADAARDLQRQAPIYAAATAKQIGADVWAKLPGNVQAGLNSVAYNYGSLPDSVVAAAKTGDPQKIGDAVEALGKNAGINNPERRKLEAALIRGQATGNGATSLADLTPDQIDKLSNAVQGQINQQRVEDNRIATQGREDIVKYGEDLIHNDPTKPQLTEAWVQANRENLTPSDYKYFKAALNKDESAIKTPPQELLRLDDLVQADPHKALTELRDGFSNHTITRGTYDQLVTRAQGIINGEEKRPYIGQIRDYLKQQITPGKDGSSTEYQTALRQLFAFDDWAAKNKDATREDAQRYASSVANSYQQFRVSALRESLPIPRFMDAPSRLVIGPDQVAAAKARTAAAFTGMIITAAEAADEANKIKAWEELISNPLYVKSF